ncbi:hypothetical protein GCM10027359_11200 [Marilutibacter aestuarii]
MLDGLKVAKIKNKINGNGNGNGNASRSLGKRSAPGERYEGATAQHAWRLAPSPAAAGHDARWVLRRATDRALLRHHFLSSQRTLG